MNTNIQYTTRNDRHYSADTAKAIATIIAEQIGGNRFVAMTGATLSCTLAGELKIALPARMSRHNITLVQVRLDVSDTYTMIFRRLRRGAMEDVETVMGVYCDQLQEVFTDITGLATHL